MKNNLTFHRVQ